MPQPNREKQKQVLRKKKQVRRSETRESRFRLSMVTTGRDDHRAEQQRKGKKKKKKKKKKKRDEEGWTGRRPW